MSEEEFRAGKMLVYGPEVRPKDGEEVVYLFEPFDSWFIGVYDIVYDSVGGNHGFTTWDPEVKAWFPRRRND